MRYEVGETVLQACSLHSHRTMADAEGWGVKRKKKRFNMEAGSASGSFKGRWKVLIRSEGCGLVLRSPHDTEPVVEADVVGQEVAALRRAAVVGDAAPDAATQRTSRASRGACGVGHAS